jgi:CysZ protein
MSLLSGLVQGLRAYPKALRLIRTHKLQRLIVLSILCYAVFLGMTAWSWWQLNDWLWLQISSFEWVQRYLHWIKSFSWIGKILQWLFYLSSLIILFSFFKYIFLALASPLYAYISERTAECLSGRVIPFNLQQFLSDIVRGIRISMHSFFRQLLMIVVLDCYYYGFSMLDYSCERQKMNVTSSRAFLSARKGLAIGNGIPMYLSLLIPFVGFVLMAPFTVVAATISFHEETQDT